MYKNMHQTCWPCIFTTFVQETVLYFAYQRFNLTVKQNIYYESISNCSYRLCASAIIECKIMPFYKEIFSQWNIMFSFQTDSTILLSILWSLFKHLKKSMSYAILSLLFSLGKYSSFIWKIIHGCSANLNCITKEILFQKEKIFIVFLRFLQRRIV